MIVRISADAQYELDDALHARLNELDDAVVAAVDGGDADGFRSRFEALLEFVRAEGALVDDDDLRPSDVIVPPEDLSFDEAGKDFTGDGLVPDPA